MRILSALIRIEAIKTMKRVAFWIGIGLFTAFCAIIASFNVYQASTNPDFSYALPESWPTVLSGLVGGGALFIPVLIILLCTSEFSWRTARQNVIDGLSKESFYAGKVVLLVGLIALFFATSIVIGAGATLFVPSEGGSALLRADDYRYMAGLTLSLLVTGGFGLMLATLIRSSGLAIGALFVYFFLEGIVALIMGRGGETLDKIADYFPMAIAQGLGSEWPYYSSVSAAAIAEQVAQGMLSLETLDLTSLVISGVLYTTLFLGVGLWSVRRRDL